MIVIDDWGLDIMRGGSNEKDCWPSCGCHLNRILVNEMRNRFGRINITIVIGVERVSNVAHACISMKAYKDTTT